jgi:hypothetical protein
VDLGDPHHVNAVNPARPAAYVRASARTGTEWHRAMKGISDRESARLSRGPRGTGLGGLRVFAANRRAIATRGTREATGMPEAAHSLTRAEESRRTRRAGGFRSEGRVVKRGFPRSRLHRVARASRCALLRRKAGESAWRDATRANTRREPRNEGIRSECAERRAWRGCCTGKRRSTSARVGVSECRSRSYASSSAEPAREESHEGSAD